MLKCLYNVDMGLPLFVGENCRNLELLCILNVMNVCVGVCRKLRTLRSFGNVKYLMKAFFSFEPRSYFVLVMSQLHILLFFTLVLELSYTRLPQKPLGKNQNI